MKPIRPNVKFILCDLDNCVFDDEWRRHHIDWEARKFTAYHDLLVNDKNLVETGAAILQETLSRHIPVLFVTARPDSHLRRSVTKINQFFGIPANEVNILMRSKGEEGVCSSQLKQKLVERYLEVNGLKKSDIIFGMDDHILVNATYRQMGINAVFVDKHHIFLSSNFNEGFEERTARLRDFASIELEPGVDISVLIDEPEKSLGLNYELTYSIVYSAINSSLRHHQLKFVGGKTKATAYSWPLSNSWPGVTPEVGCAEQNPSSTAELFSDVAKETGFPASKLSGEGLTFEGWLKIARGREEGESAEPLFMPHDEGKDESSVQTTVTSRRMPTQNAGDILGEAAETFKERNAMYKDNAFIHSKIMAAMFPNGVTLKTEEDYHMWHLFELLIVKLSRFSNSGLKHQDSIRDLAVYAAMVETLVNTHSISFNTEG